MMSNYHLLLCQIVGLVLTIVTLGILINRKHFLAMANSVINTPAIHFPATIIPLILGSIIVLTHNDWSNVYCILVSLIGWLMLIGGIVRALFPNFWIGTMSKHYQSGGIVVVMVILLIVGVVLLYGGFFAA